MKRTIVLYLIIFSFANTWAQVPQATLLGQWQGDNLIGSAAFDNAYNEIWGIAVNNKEFAVIGSTEGTHFIDVTDPSNPTEVQFVEGAVSGPTIVHRDYHDNGCFLYAVADEPGSVNATVKSTLQIMDISNLPGPVEVVYDSDELLFRSHNIFIDEPNNRLYACIANGTLNQEFSAIRIYDITDPRNPQFLALHNDLEGLPIQQVHDGFFKDHIGYLNLGPGGFAVAYFLDPESPVVLGTMDSYPEQGYNHSGCLDQSGQYYYMADETWGTRIKVLYVRDPSDINIVNYIDAGNPSPFSITHNQLVACDYLYVSYYYDGLQVYDISDPANPIRVLEFDTSNKPDAMSYEGAWGVYPYLPSGNILVSDMQEGLFVFEAIDDSNCIQRRQICEGVSSSAELEDKASISIWPNPTAGSITLQLPEDLNLEEMTLTIQDLNGKVISVSNSPLLQAKQIVELPKYLAAGLYIVTIQSDNYRSSQKLVIE